MSIETHVSIADAWHAAWRFAAHAHRSQTLPASDLSYLVHVGAVAMEVVLAHQTQAFRRPLLAVQCALLHDVLEDTEVREEELADRFGTEVAAGVRALTKRKTLAKDEAMADSLRRIREQPEEVWAVKLADRIVNLGPPPSSWTAKRIARYREEAVLILEKLRTAHPPLASRLAARIATYPPMREQCPRCHDTDLVIKKFTVGAAGTTVFDFLCRKCGLLETVKCDEPGWEAALSRWLGSDGAKSAAEPTQ